MPIPARVAQWNKVGLNRVVRTIANAVGSATDGGAQDPRSPTYNPVVNLSDRDRISQTSYDLNGRVLYTEDSLGRRLTTTQAPNNPLATTSLL